jgi:MoCo/4Fe-4S cofactor protein with predicted Tat translocation signal
MSLIQIEGSSVTGRKYWRSLDQLAGTPEFKTWVEREFSEDASEMLSGKSRRTVLKLMAASFGLAGLTACRRPEANILPLAKSVEDYIPGQAYFYATAMPLGGTVAGVLVETHDGRPTKIEGNPDHPNSLGAASALAQASVLSLYDPDRARQVTLDGQPSSWEAFARFAVDHFGKAGEGLGVRFLSERVTSPSLDAVRKHALEKWPKAKWVEYEPVNDDQAIEGAQIAFGRALRAHPQFDKARIIVALDADFLGVDSHTVLPIKQYSKGRRIEGRDANLNRLYAVGSNYTLTGAAADHRLRMRGGDVQTFALDLAAAISTVSALNVLNHAGSSRQAKFLKTIVKDLKVNPGNSLVVAGPRQPASVHALACLINATLGNLGQAVTFTEVPDWTPCVPAMTQLNADIARGEVHTVVILGGNPIYSAPADVDLASALKRVPTTIALGLDEDETASAAKWHLPEAHYLESWSDGRAQDGAASIIQPMIEPLFGGKTAAEVVALIEGFKDQRAFDIVRNYWIRQWPAAQQEKTWRESLHNGVIAGTKAPEVKAAADPKRPLSFPSTTVQGMEVGFFPSASLYDGRFANNGWMQEAPDPMTKLVWGNAALLSPATARQLGVADGDFLAITLNNLTLEIPALIQPGHADNSISLSLGYGRKKCGRVGRNVGFNSGALRSSDAFWYASGFAVSKTGRTFTNASTQHHHSMEGRPIVREATLAEYKTNPKFAEEMAETPELFSLHSEYKYDQGYQWGMAIDLTSCIGCNACMLACQAENNIPVVGKEEVLRGREMHWIRMDRYYTGDENDPQVVYQGVPCMHARMRRAKTSVRWRRRFTAPRA